MVRVFSHYVQGRLLLFFFLEALVFMLAISAGLAFQRLDPDLIGFDAAVPPPAAAGMIIVMSSMGLYQRDTWNYQQPFFLRLIIALLIGLTLILLMTYPISSMHLRPSGLLVTLAFGVLGSALLRLAFSKWSESATLKRRVLVLGTGSRVMRLAELAQHNQNHRMVGYLTLQPTTNHYVPLPEVLTLPPGESLVSLVEKCGIDQVVIALRDRRGGLPVQELLECRMKGITITELPTFFEREYRQVLLESLNTSWIMLGDGFRQGVFRSAVKRLFDLTASALLLLFTFPVMLIAAACILLESGLPALFRQERVGQGGRVFTMYKLRSMKKEAERDGTPRWAALDDDRVTKVGRILRKLRIDELPQIFNVFRGEMSFVGPRPERPFFVDKLVKQVPYYALRHNVKPGITGWAQVNYRYGASLDDVVEKLQYDLYYVKNHTLFLDLVVLSATVEVVLWNKGAR
jgi:sugar transferase (PEP-CTERM system associated)